MLIRKSNRKNTEKSKISKFLISLSFSAKNQRTRKKLGKIITWNFLLFKYKKQAGIGVMIVFVLSSAFYLYFNQVKQSLAADTGFLSPTANAAVAGQGDGNGYETTPTNAYADGAPGSAVDTNSGANTNNTCTVVGADMHTWSSYGISIPAGASINGIEVRQDLAVDNISNGPFSCVALSWDGGTTWTTAQSITLTATGETTYTYGGSASLWGRTWAVGDFSNANFRVRITNGDTINTASTKDFSLDWIPVKVYYSAAYTQSAFRWFANTDTTNVGAAMATQDTAATLTSTGQAFRLRTLIHVAGSTLGLNGDNFKLQYVDKGTGTCASPSGGVPAAYTDVDTTTLIAYKNNTPADAANLTDNVGELTHGADTIVPETYEELNNFTNSRTAINAGEDGKWDFALYDNDAFSASTYCFRIVKSDGTALNTYTVYPSITTATKSCSNELIATDSAASVVVYNVRRSALGGTIPSKNLGTIAITSYSAARRASDGLVFILQRGAGAGLNKLYSFNTSTGVSVLIGTVGSSVPDIYRLAFNGSNVLWAMDNNNVLYTLNTSTAVPTTVCNPVTGTNLVTAGGGDFAYSANGTLYLVANNTTNRLYTINTGTCISTYIGDTTLTTFASIAFDASDVLYAARYTGQDLYTINKSTGVATLIAAFSPAITLYDFASCPVTNVAPNAPTLVSPGNGTSTNDNTPTLSANYSDPDAGDTGTTNYRIATSAANCLAGTVVASGTSAATSSNNEKTTWTPGSSIGSDATYYWCAQNNDGVLTSSWTTMGSFILDTTGPTLTFSDNVAAGPVVSDTITATWGDATVTKWNYDADGVCSTLIGDYPNSGPGITTQTTETNNTKYICLYAEDALGNKSTLASADDINIDITGPTLIFTDNVASGPVQSDTITATWGDATVTKWNYDADGVCSTLIGDYPNSGPGITTQTTETNNSKYICLYVEDALANKSTLASANDINIDITGPTILFTDNVASGPVLTDTITATWGDATVKKWDYDADGVCSTNAIDYTKTDANSMNQTTETNNTKYICLYGEDALGNKTTLASADDINIDVTGPTLIFTDNVASGPVPSDTITATWGDAMVKKWDYDTDGVCSTNAIDYTKTDANSMNQTTETNNTKYICLYGEDALGNKSTSVSSNAINIDVTGPTLIFTDNVASGPVVLDTVTATWGDALVKKWDYDADGVCSTTAGDYTKLDTDSMNQTTETNNGKYICLYAEDALGNKSTLVSTNDINIDITGPTILFTDNVASGPVLTDNITATWGDAAVKKWDYDADGVCSTNAGDYTKTDADSMNQTTETNNGKYICLYAEDALGNKSISTSANDINIDTTGPTLIFTDNVASGPELTDTVTATWGDATVKKWNYDADGICSVNSGDYPYTDANSMTQSAETNNTKYICLYGEDSLGNKTTLVSANDINIDITGPTLIFTDNVASGPVQADTISATWGDATVKKWDYDTDGICSTNAGVYTKTDANSMNQTTETNNTKYICLYAEDALANKSTLASANAIDIDITGPTLSFTDNVASGPVLFDTIIGTWGDATVKKWDYDADGICSVNAGDYTKTDANSMDQSTEVNNTKYICLYGEDALGNKSTLVSANVINIDITPPAPAFFIDDVAAGPVISDTITVSWAVDAVVKKWNYDADGVCSTSSGDYPYTDANSMDQTTETNNGNYLCLYEEDIVGNKTTVVSANDINIDITGPTLIFTDNVASGPGLTDTVTATWGDATVKKWNYDADGICSVNSGDYPYTDANSMTQSAETNNTKYFCLYGEDSLGNKTTLVSANDINIDTTGPTLIFTDNVAAGPVVSDTISATWGDATVKKWDYDTDGVCSSNPGDYTNLDTDSMNQATETNNTKYICLYGEDALGNKSTLVSANAIDIDITGPTLSFTNDVASGPVLFDTITVTWGDATVKKWDYDADGICSVNAGDYTKTDADSMNQTTETNNGKYICLYAEDTLSNKTILASAYGINVDITGPTLIFTDNVDIGPAVLDTITATWGDATVTKWNYDADGVCSAITGDYPTFGPGITTQTTEINNAQYICLYAEDALGNITTMVSANDINIDVTGPTLIFTDNVASGPVLSDTITATWGDATVKEWDYDADGVCSTNAGDYTKTDADSMNQATETNNGKYICLYAEDALGNKSTLASANDLNIDITGPTISFTDDVAAGPVLFDNITATWGDAALKKWDYDADGICSVNAGDYTKTDADSMNQTTETNNGKYICLYAEGVLGNKSTAVSANDINLDIGGTSLAFSDDVAAGPVIADTITGVWGVDAAVKKWNYDSDGVCSLNSSDYPYTDASSMNQASEINNGNYICLYGEDALGNKSTLPSANPINIDITGPTLIFTDNVAIGPVASDTITATWGDAILKEWDYDADGICSMNAGDYTKTDANSMNQITEINDGKYICLYAEDALGNKTTLASANDINIDIIPNLSTSTKSDNDFDNRVLPGQSITFTVTVKNTGNGKATGVNVADVIDTDMENLSVTSLTNCGAFTDNSIPTKLDIVGAEIAVGTDCVIVFTADVKSPLNEGTSITNTAIISAAAEGGVGATPSSDALTVNATPDFSTSTKVENDADNYVAPSQIVTYTVKVKNTGDGNASGVSITDTIDTDLENLIVPSITDCGPIINGSSGTALNLTNAAITLGTDCVIVFTAEVKNTALNGATIPNTVTISPASEGGVGAGPSSGTLTVDAEAPTITITAPTKDSNATIGDTTITVTDNISVLIADVAIDPLTTAGIANFNCVQTLATQVDCTMDITFGGDLVIAATDEVSNLNQQTEAGYTIESDLPLISITAPTKIFNSNITDTTVRVIDNDAINAANVSAVGSATPINLNCTQTDIKTVDCTVEITTSGDLVINATDNAANPNSLTEAGYVIDNTAPNIVITAPTKLSNAIITDTTILITDNRGIHSASITIDPSTTAGTGNFSCIQTSAVQVDCTIDIISSGDLVIKALDIATNQFVQTEAGYVISTAAPIITITAPTKISTATIADTTIRITDAHGVLVANVSIDLATTAGTANFNCVQTLATQVDCTIDIISSGDLVIKAVDNLTNQATEQQPGAAYIIDNTPPLGSIDLTIGATTASTQVLNWTPVTEINFSHYEIWYGTNQIDVQNRAGSAVKWDHANDPLLANILTSSTIIRGLNPDTTYYYKLWAVDLLNNETTAADVNAKTLAGGGGHPSIFPANYSVQINTGSDCVSSTSVTLNLQAQNAVQVTISNDINFIGATWEAFTTPANRSWSLLPGDGLKTVYVIYRSSDGNLSPVLSDTIFLDSSACQVTPIEPPIPPEEIPVPPPTENTCELNCQDIDYELYIVNPNGTMRSMNSDYARKTDLGNNITQINFEDSGQDFDYNDVIINVDKSNCKDMVVQVVSVKASWHHQVRMKLFYQGSLKTDVLVFTDSHLASTEGAAIIRSEDQPELCVAEQEEPKTICGVDCQLVDYELYIINPDSTIRYMNSNYAQIKDLGRNIKYIGFEDSGQDFDYNDVVIEVDKSNCKDIIARVASVSASWHHQIRMKLFYQGEFRVDVLVFADSQAALLGDAKKISLANQPELCEAPAELKSGDIFKGSADTIYYYGADGRRYAFPNKDTYLSWYPDFKYLKNVSDSTLDQIALGTDVTYKPGVRLLKLPLDIKVFAVDLHGVLRHILNEFIAAGIYGMNWQTFIDDLNPDFLTDYKFGPVLDTIGDYIPGVVSHQAGDINKDLQITPK